MSLFSGFSIISVSIPVELTFQLFEKGNTYRLLFFTWLPIKLEELSVSEITDLLSNTVEIHCLQQHLSITDRHNTHTHSSLMQA